MTNPEFTKNMFDMELNDLNRSIIEAIGKPSPSVSVRGLAAKISEAINPRSILMKLEISSYWRNLETLFSNSSPMLLAFDLDPTFLSQANQYRKNVYDTLQKFGVQCSECSYSDASISLDTSAKRNLAGFIEKVYAAVNLCKQGSLAILENSHFKDITCTIINPHQLFDNEGSEVCVSPSPTRSLKNLSTFPNGVVNFISHLLLIARSGYNLIFPPKNSVQLNDLTSKMPGVLMFPETLNEHHKMLIMAYLSQKLLMQHFKSQSIEIDCKSCEEQTLFNIFTPAEKQQLEISLFNRMRVLELCNELATKLSSTVNNQNQCEPLTYQDLVKPTNYLLSCYVENPSALLTDPNYQEDLVEKVSIAIADQDIGAAGNLGNIGNFMIET